MDKKKYYVSVQAGSVLENQGDAAYEFEIFATEPEVDDLIERFGMLSDQDNASGFRAHLPGVPYHQDAEHDGYDYVLTEVYRKLYELGTEETKHTIAGMGSIGEQDRPVP
ncbi:MAG: hypothetical protein K0Q94_1407 [Paenibacillus sp.]|uniref:hypothetical protein n=1 Tax=Paenibacillus sp. GCM10012303 TaxID=3317340 RepID=UPI0029EA886F|nr:hypothetical protein [Paenibacillus sp.]